MMRREVATAVQPALMLQCVIPCSWSSSTPYTCPVCRLCSDVLVLSLQNLYLLCQQLHQVTFPSSMSMSRRCFCLRGSAHNRTQFL